MGSAAVKEITYQEAWNKISEFLKKDGYESFFVDSYSSEKCKLYIYDKKGERINQLIEE